MLILKLIHVVWVKAYTIMTQRQTVGSYDSIVPNPRPRRMSGTAPPRPGMLVLWPEVCVTPTSLPGAVKGHIAG